MNTGAGDESKQVLSPRSLVTEEDKDILRHKRSRLTYPLASSLRSLFRETRESTRKGKGTDLGIKGPHTRGRGGRCLGRQGRASQQLAGHQTRRTSSPDGAAEGSRKDFIAEMRWSDYLLCPKYWEESGREFGVQLVISPQKSKPANHSQPTKNPRHSQQNVQ